jgi:hypothetical protein
VVAPDSPSRTERLIVPDGADSARTPRGVDARKAYRLVVAAASAVLLISFANLVMLWWSPQFGVAQWEFSVTTQTLDRFEPVLIGFLLLALAAVLNGSLAFTRGVALLAGFMLLIMLAVGVLFVFASAQAWGVTRAANPDALGLLKRSIAKNLFFLTIIVTYFAGFAFLLVRRGGR